MINECTELYNYWNRLFVFGSHGASREELGLLSIRGESNDRILSLARVESNDQRSPTNETPSSTGQQQWYLDKQE